MEIFKGKNNQKRTSSPLTTYGGQKNKREGTSTKSQQLLQKEVPPISNTPQALMAVNNITL